MNPVVPEPLVLKPMVEGRMNEQLTMPIAFESRVDQAFRRFHREHPEVLERIVELVQN